MEKRRTSKSVKIDETESKKNSSGFKNYLKKFILFINKYMKKNLRIVCIIVILFALLSVKPILSKVVAKDCVGTCMDSNVSFFGEYWQKILPILMIGVSGLVPYVYLPAICGLGFASLSVVQFAYVIKGYGYFKGILLGIVPLLLDLSTYCIIIVLGIYICKTITIGYRISNASNMNFTNFRIKFYEAIGKEKEEKKLTDKMDKKIATLSNKKEKLQYIQILNVLGVVAIMQLVSTILQIIIR